jgi:hypothetical protein
VSHRHAAATRPRHHNVLVRQDITHRLKCTPQAGYVYSHETMPPVSGSSSASFTCAAAYGDAWIADALGLSASRVPPFPFSDGCRKGSTRRTALGGALQTIRKGNLPPMPAVDTRPRPVATRDAAASELKLATAACFDQVPAWQAVNDWLHFG